MNHIETVFFQRFKKKLKERQEEIITVLISGCGSWDEYLRSNGAYYGLGEAEAIAENIRNEMSKE